MKTESVDATVLAMYLLGIRRENQMVARETTVMHFIHVTSGVAFRLLDSNSIRNENK